MSNSAFNPGARVVGGNIFHSDETVTGSVNGSNTSFTTTSPYMAGTLEVFINGLRQARTTHVTESSPTTGVFTLDVAPQTSDVLRVNYQTTVASSFAADTVDGFHASSTPAASTLLALNSRAQTGEWYEELGKTILTVAGDTITVNSIPARKHLRIIVTLVPSGAVGGFLRFNNDATSTYSNRNSSNGAADATQVSQTGIYAIDASANAELKYSVIDVLNIATLEKLVISSTIEGGTAGASNAPQKREGAGKWTNTSNQITRVDVVNTQAGDFAVGSEVIVLGHD